MVGENTTCKTAVLDALRLCLGLSLERRDLYVQPQDFYSGRDGNQSTVIDIDLTFSDLSTQQQGVFVEMLAILDDGTPILRLHVRLTRDGDRIRRTVWGGANEGQDVPQPVLELFYFTHLGALRDAARDLAPSRSNRLSQLFLKLVADQNQRETLAAEINAQVRAAASWQTLLTTAMSKIRDHLHQMVLSGDRSTVAIEFVDASFKEITEGLRLFVPRAEQDQTPADQADGAPADDHGNRFSIAQNSLGYNNLLYIATVLGDLLERTQREPHSYTALLIEEPEAHLHPHWQNTLFGYLRSIQKHGIQVFISSHSPTITAKSDIDAVIGMYRGADAITTTPIRDLALSDANKKHLQRFLDVTKCQLFFARAVVLVEGISEALLMPSFAQRMGSTFDLDKTAVEVVNVGGVAFEPFAALFNCTHPARRLNVRCSIITDDDRGTGADPAPRATKALALQTGLVQVFLAHETFEFELYLHNEQIVLEIYQSMHPQTDLTFTGTTEERARAFVDKLKVNKDKAEFAQRLASVLQEGNSAVPFAVPDYIQRALRWAIFGHGTTTDGTAATSHQ